MSTHAKPVTSPLRVALQPISAFNHHVAVQSSAPRPNEIRAMWRRGKEHGHGFNARVAVIVCAVLGSMPMFWFSIVLALLSLPAVLSAFSTEVLSFSLGLPTVITKVSLIALIAWVAQTFIQLVALPVLQVSNNAQMAQVEAGLAKLHTFGQTTVENLDLAIEGGQRAVLEALAEIGAKLDVKIEVPTLHSGAGAPPD
jgi:hypothetical protein